MKFVNTLWPDRSAVRDPIDERRKSLGNNVIADTMTLPQLAHQPGAAEHHKMLGDSWLPGLEPLCDVLHRDSPRVSRS